MLLGRFVPNTSNVPNDVLHWETEGVGFFPFLLLPPVTGTVVAFLEFLVVLGFEI